MESTEAKPRVAYPNPRAAAIAVEHWVEHHDVPAELSARPWNRFDPYHGQWYLVPSTDWPAYRFGKLSLRELRERKSLYCSYYVEKGLDPSLAVAFPKGKKLMMTEEWTWHRVVRDIASGEVAQAADEVMQHSGWPLLVSVDGGYIEDPGSYDPQGPRPNWNRLLFAYQDGGLRLLSSEVPDAHFQLLLDCGQMCDLSQRIPAMQAIGWTWIDLHFGLEFEMVPLQPEETPDEGAWGAEQLWQRCFAPWNRWVV